MSSRRSRRLPKYPADHEHDDGVFATGHGDNRLNYPPRGADTRTVIWRIYPVVYCQILPSQIDRVGLFTTQELRIDQTFRCRTRHIRFPTPYEKRKFEHTGCVRHGKDCIQVFEDGFGLYLNHSDVPNCQLEICNRDFVIGRVIVGHIPVGVELTINYNGDGSKSRNRYSSPGFRP